MKKILSLVLVLITLTCLIIPANASSSAIAFNVSSTPCSANLSNANLPAAQIPKKGDTFYINLAATNDFKLIKAEFYVKTPSSSDFSNISTYAPSGYFRWVNVAYTFSQCGTYTIKIRLTRNDGAIGSGQTEFYVEEKSSTSDDTYEYDGKTYNVVNNFNSKYCFNQKNYNRFINASGRNTGCTATAMCSAYSILHDSTLSPNDVKWSSAGCSWEYCNRYSDGEKTYYAYNYTQEEALSAAYNSISNDVPVIVGVKGAGCDHVVTIVGVRNNASSANLSLSDFLIVDPWRGDIEALDTYTGIDTSWSLRIPA